MATTYVMSPITLLVQLFNNVGIVLNGGSIETYLAGTTTPVTTYTDSTGTTANADPIQLNSAGRMVAAGTGAPVACWVPQGTAHKAVWFDSSGNQMGYIDNLTGINDISALLTELANPTAGQGVDLVANAVKGYFNFAAMRAAPVPAPVANQTVVCIAACQATEADLRGGAFLWDSTLTNADDNYQYINPTANTGNGRWRRIPQPYLPSFDKQTAAVNPNGNPVDQGGFAAASFTGSLTGFASPIPVNLTYYIVGLGSQSNFAMVVMQGGPSGTSNATTMTITGLPASLTPSTFACSVPCIIEDNGTVQLGVASLSGTTITFGKTVSGSGGFTASGTKGLPGSTVFMIPLN